MKEKETQIPHRISHDDIKMLLEKNEEKFTDIYVSDQLVLGRTVDFTFVKDLLARPVKTEEMRILLCLSGEEDITINLIGHHIVAGDLVYMSRNSIAQIHRTSADIQVIGVSMTDEFFRQATHTAVPKSFNGHLRDFIIHLTPPQIAYIETLYSMLYNNQIARHSSPQVAFHLTAALLWHIDNLQTRQEADTKRQRSREEQLFTDFITLVSKHAARQHHIAFYAEQLCLSPRYMSAIVKQASGKAAKTWIDEALMTMAKVRLLFTDNRISEISDELGFANVSFFCKFFKRLTDLSPLAYKERF